MSNYFSFVGLAIILLISLMSSIPIIKTSEINAETINNNNTQTSTISSLSDKQKTSKPMIFVKASCQEATTEVGGEFNATGFTPNVNVIVKIDKNNSTSTNPTEPFTLIFGKPTDSDGNLIGEFIWHTQVQEPETAGIDYLHISSASGPPETASTPLNNIC